jgi:molybdopterin-guanine dinucleotide biosynthesis protein A
MDAIVTAGGIPQPGDPLYVYSNGDSKALIDVAGKPMVQWILDALGDAKSVDNVIVIGLSAKSGLTCKKPIHYISNQGRMLANIVTGVSKAVELNKKNEYVLLVSSDIPAIKPDMVDWLVETCMETKDDLYYGVCPREVMETRYPTSKRTFTKLKDMEVCGSDVNVIHVSMTTDHLDTWEELIGNRKSPLRQALSSAGIRSSNYSPANSLCRLGRTRVTTHRHQRPRHHLGPRRTLHGCGQAASTGIDA